MNKILSFNNSLQQGGSGASPWHVPPQGFSFSFFWFCFLCFCVQKERKWTS